VDEAGIDDREEYPYGYCERGQPFHALQSGKRTEPSQWDGRTSARITLCPDYLRRILQPRFIRAVVRAVMPASIVATRIDEMVAAAGCELWYFPPYSRLLKQN
ncbi:MAG: hypothetical protein BRC57_12700, partial [Cyanobacteria bacterium QS_8_48_54]